MNNTNKPVFALATLRFVVVRKGEKDSKFLHNNGVNQWPIVKTTTLI